METLIQPRNNELGNDEVVDMLSDAIEIAAFVEERTKDGLGGDDLFALIPKYPVFVEMWNDRKTFAAEFVDLTSSEWDDAVIKIAARTGKSEGFVRSKAIEALKISSRAVNLYVYNKREITGIIADFKTLIQRKEAA